MELKTKTIEYNFKENEKTADYDKIFSEQRTATIIFKKGQKLLGHDMIDALWEFKECKYSELSKIYTEEDWDFLKEVADEINNIKKKLNK